MKLFIPGLVGKNGLMNPEYTFDGVNVNPEIYWAEPPENTKSFAILCHDPDAAIDWVHWIVINIPPDTLIIPKGGPVPGEQVDNDFGHEHYEGPAPPSGTHRYFFKIFALSVKKLEGVDRNNFLEKIKPFILDRAEVMAKYRRNL